MTSIRLADPVVRLDFDAGRVMVTDVIPNAPRTALIRDAEEPGWLVLDRMGMLDRKG